MIVVYGSGDVITHFNQKSCDIDFMKDNDVTREHIQAIFFGALGSWSIAHNIYGEVFPKEIKVINFRAMFYWFSFILGMTTIILTQYGVFTGSCKLETGHDSTIESVNGRVTAIEIYAGIVFTLLLALSVNNMEILSHQQEDGKRILVKFTNEMSLFTWVTRILFTAFLIVVVTSDSFYKDHGNTQLAHTTCKTEAARINKDSVAYKFYESIELRSVDYDSSGEPVVDKNDNMVNTLWSLVAALSVEFLFRVTEIYQMYYGEGDMQNSDTMRKVMVGSKFAAFYTDIVLAIFTYSLIMSNDIAACPLLNPDDNAVQNVYWSSILYLVAGFITIAVNKFRVLEYKDDGDVSKLGMVLPMSGMYSHL